MANNADLYQSQLDLNALEANPANSSFTIDQAKRRTCCLTQPPPSSSDDDYRYYPGGPDHQPDTHSLGDIGCNAEIVAAEDRPDQRNLL